VTLPRYSPPLSPPSHGPPGSMLPVGIHERLGMPVNFFPIQGLKEFFLVVLIGRCKYQLNDQLVGFLLQATLGSVSADFRLQQLSDQVFKFSVASRAVGFHIYNMWMFACDQYKIFFHLFGNGGAHWVSKYKKFLQEEEDDWIPALGKKSQILHQKLDRDAKITLSGANRVPIGRNCKFYMPHVHRDSAHAREHQQMINFHQKNLAERTSVFQRISWPKPVHQRSHVLALLKKLIWR
jgi:hypothetical protein